MIYIVSLGGSLIAPAQGVDSQYLKKFRQFILARIKIGDKFFLVAGGGSTCRNYQRAAIKVAKITLEDLDWLGIHSSRLNGQLLRAIFFEVASPEIIINPTKKIKTAEPLVIAAAWKPGWSTDYIAVQLAKKYNIKNIINLSNIDFVYDKDPKKCTSAKKIKSISWPDFRKIVGYAWTPGLSAPFDPVASALAEKLKLKVVIMNGRKLKNLHQYFSGGRFNGTVIF